jgi:Zn-dependent protease with chaperone function
MTIFRAAVILSAVMLGACGPVLQTLQVSPDLLRQEAALQREFTYKMMIERRMKLQRIYTALRIANADICGEKVTPVTGIMGIDRQTLDPELREIAQRLHGLSDGIMILDLVPGSPATESGLLRGDVITGAAKGAGVIPSGWTWSALTIPELVKVIEASAGAPMTLLVRRAGNTFPLTLTPQLGCRYPIELKIDQRLNAAADGSKITVNTGTFTYVPDDHQLAFLVGHELAHNILEHVQKKQGNAAAGAAAGAIFDIGLAVVGINSQGLGMRTGAEVGAKAYSQEFESEADYLGLYLLARAGFDITGAQELFRRMGAEKPIAQVQDYSSTHPSTPERAVAMQQAVTEIRAKTNTQQALLPATLPGEALSLKPIHQQPVAPIIVASQPQVSLQQTSVISPAVQHGSAFAPASQSSQAIVTQPATPPAQASSAVGRALAQLFLIRGPIVSNPPQAFSAEFLPTGKVQVILSGRRLLTGDFELFGPAESIKAKYKAALINPDGLKLSPGADTKGFAALSDGSGTQLECVYSLTRATGRGEGTCADNQRNTYRLVFD